MTTLFDIESQSSNSAVISPCGTYRYRLTRRWSDGDRRVVWFMFNPSTADADIDDPTIRKCVGFSQRWGFDALDVVNLFAFRSTDPSDLLTVVDPIGDDNALNIARAVRDAEQMVCAWGCETWLARMQKMGWRPTGVIDSIREAMPKLPIVCLGKSKSGNPYHPLMLAYETERVPFEVRP